MRHYLEFEKPLAEIEADIDRLKARGDLPTKPDAQQIKKLERDARKKLKELYSGLSPWEKCQIARHPSRPHCSDYLKFLFTDRTRLAGDRGFSEDSAVIGTLARFDGRPVIVIGQEKGHDTKTRLAHNFGMARPEGYRKAIRLMDLADRFRLPVITLVDTPGAYPGKGAEERGQSEAIARSTEKCLLLRVPLLSVIIGEGGSGGAIALATADRTAMLEHSIYSVISPEGCASILWQDAQKIREAAEALRLTAEDLQRIGVVDEVISEPLGGAQRNPRDAIDAVGKTLAKMLAEVSPLGPDELLRKRREKFTAMGGD
ncbi:MAG: acetyl-CoA carboxylase carboxyltransferase subunit alpha [Rhodobacteraceae bacterium]|nr:acetyl-CoA carboxylase carboxyltransferase subunit alpha [Paracoccaceae bacterium]